MWDASPRKIRHPRRRAYARGAKNVGAIKVLIRPRARHLARVFARPVLCDCTRVRVRAITAT